MLPPHTGPVAIHLGRARFGWRFVVHVAGSSSRNRITTRDVAGFFFADRRRRMIMLTALRPLDAHGVAPFTCQRCLGTSPNGLHLQRLLRAVSVLISLHNVCMCRRRRRRHSIHVFIDDCRLEAGHILGRIAPSHDRVLLNGIGAGVTVVGQSTAVAITAGCFVSLQ